MVSDIQDSNENLTLSQAEKAMTHSGQTKKTEQMNIADFDAEVECEDDGNSTTFENTKQAISLNINAAFGS